MTESVREFDPNSPSRAREREDEDEREQSEELTCPECDGQLATDEERGETVCSDCGLVVEEDSIDRGPSGARSTQRRKTRSPGSAPPPRT